VCSKLFNEITNHNQDLSDLVATIQRHTKCSPAYCLKNGPKGITKCRFNFPKQLEAKSRLEIKKDDITLLTRRNDPLVNSYNPVQLVSWRANVDLQACVSRHKVVSYTAKYASKSEPRSKTLAEIFSKILENKEDVTNKKLAQKILIESVANRDYPAAEVCHLLLQLPLYTSSRDFVTLNLDDSLQVVATKTAINDQQSPPSLKSTSRGQIHLYLKNSFF
jgi:hypothetical protein